MGKKEKKKLIKLIKKLNIMSWGIQPRKNNDGWYDISLSGYIKGERDNERNNRSSKRL